MRPDDIMLIQPSEISSMSAEERDAALVRCIHWIDIARRYGVDAADTLMKEKESA